MIAPGMVLVFLGYSLGSWGYCLVRGWDITLRQWMSPTNPWTWPAGDVPTVPPGQIMPGGSSAAAAGSVGNFFGGIGNAAVQGGQAVAQQTSGGVGGVSINNQQRLNG